MTRGLTIALALTAAISGRAAFAETLLTHRIPAALAAEAAGETVAACVKQGYHETAVVLDADGAVIVAATTPLEVFLAVQQSGRHPFVIRVGHEDEPWYRIRRTTFAYDTAYPTAALPVLSAEFRSASGFTSLHLDRVIPDTGADTTTLPWSDCQQLHLDPALGVPGVISGNAGGMAVPIGFLIWVWLDDQEYPCQLQAAFVGQERILGRDVLNRLEMLFRGPTGEVIVNP